jgi:MFS family permease
MTAALRRPFGSLAVPNYRRYFAGQVISLSGNWMQTVAEVWLILHLTGSGTMVGLAAALQFLPVLLAGAWGGLLADRIPKRRLLTITQALMAIPAFTLWALTATGGVETWMVLALIFTRGAVNAVDNPARQSFVVEMVGPERLVNAVSLNSVLVHTARIVGPATAGAIIALAGVAPCFLLNTLTFVAMLVALRRMDPAELRPAPRASREPGQLRLAMRHVLETPSLRIPLAMMAVVGTLSFNFQVLLPLLAKFTWDGNASAYAALTAAMGVGSVAGALASGARGRVSPRLLTVASVGFGALMLLAAVAPTFPLQLAALVPLGAMSVTFAAGVNSSLQLAVTPEMRGRVMALYSVVFLGSTPVGGPITGWLSEVAGPRAGLVLGGVAALAAGLVARRAFARAGVAAGAPVGTPAAPAPASAVASAVAVAVAPAVAPAVAGDEAVAPAHRPAPETPRLPAEPAGPQPHGARRRGAVHAAARRARTSLRR